MTKSAGGSSSQHMGNETILEDHHGVQMIGSDEAGPSNADKSQDSAVPSPMKVSPSLSGSLETPSAGKSKVRTAKRPLNSFMLYRKAKQNEIPTSDHKSVSRIIGALWRNETAMTKAHYTRLADEGREQHARDFPDYQFRPKRRKAAAAPEAPEGASKKKSRLRESKIRCDEENDILRVMLPGREGVEATLTPPTNPAERFSSETGAGSMSSYSLSTLSRQRSTISCPASTITPTYEVWQQEPTPRMLEVEDVLATPTLETQNTSMEVGAAQHIPRSNLDGLGLGISLLSPTLQTSDVWSMSERELDEYFDSIRSGTGEGIEVYDPPFFSDPPSFSPYLQQPDHFYFTSWDDTVSHLADTGANSRSQDSEYSRRNGYGSYSER